MADKKKPHDGGKVLVLPSNCPVDDCKQKPRRANFCSEHFVWFKEGLVSRSGEKPTDFDKKMQAFNRRTSKAA